MDVYIGKRLYEKFVAPPGPKAKELAQQWTFGSVVGIILLIGLGSWAAFLSWEANTLVGWSVVAKVIFSFLSFLNGAGYLLSYAFMKYDLIVAIRALTVAAQTLPPIGGRK